MPQRGAGTQTQRPQWQRVFKSLFTNARKRFKSSLRVRIAAGIPFKGGWRIPSLIDPIVYYRRRNLCNDIKKLYLRPVSTEKSEQNAAITRITYNQRHKIYYPLRARVIGLSEMWATSGTAYVNTHATLASTAQGLKKFPQTQTQTLTNRCVRNNISKKADICNRFVTMYVEGILNK